MAGKIEKCDTCEGEGVINCSNDEGDYEDVCPHCLGKGKVENPHPARGNDRKLKTGGKS